MKILVCISNVPDTTTKVKFKNDNTEFDTTGVQWIINPWDELALTRALQLKEDSNNSVESVTVATVGTNIADQTLRKAMAIGADNAIRVDTEPKDAYYVAAQLAEVVKNNEFDIIFVVSIKKKTSIIESNSMFRKFAPANQTTPNPPRIRPTLANEDSNFAAILLMAMNLALTCAKK